MRGTSRGGWAGGRLVLPGRAGAKSAGAGISPVFTIFGGMKESKFVKTKIVAGYVILIAVCVLSVGYVYRAVVRFSTSDGSYSLLHTKRNVVGQTLYHLYQAESYGQLMIAGYKSYEARYKRELRTVRGYIDSLRDLTGEQDSLQTMRLDSIERLLGDKERRTMNLRRTIRSAGTASLLDKNIRELLGPADSTGNMDSVVRAVDTAVLRTVLQDTVALPRRKRNFFRRFADLFSPPEEEPNIIISRHERVVDSLPAVAVKDTIAVVLRTLQDRVTSDRIGIYDRAWNEGMRLRYSNELVNTKIYRLIMDFEAEDTAFVMDRIERTEAIRRRSSLTLGVIAIAAVVLMLLFVAILWRDINRGNRYRRELEQANRDNEALLAAREKLMLAITHDIKAPLGSVMGYIDLLSRLTTDKREALYLQNMKGSSEHLLALVNSLLDFYRLDINKVDVDKVAFCPAQLFGTIRDGFAAQAGAKGIGLALDIEPAAEGEVTGDPFRIRQIADNLISNALKFTDEGSVTIRVDVVQGRLVFSVRDTGRGIGREEKERIFHEFVRLRSAQGVDGFGLGLSIVDRLVKLLEGTISLESRLGEGSKFIVSVPVGAAVRGASRKPVPAEAPPQAVCPGARVLLIDDDPLQLEMTAAMCRQAGMGAECCQYPEYAAKLVAEGAFDVVLTDIQMPSADGFGVLAAVRGVNPALPVVAVSARGEMDAGDFAARGFAGCLRKPFTANELIAVLNAVCGDGRIREPDGNIPVAEAAPGGGVDFASLTAYAGDDAAAARGILESFAEQGAANCLVLEGALAGGDVAALRAIAHKMLPIFTMLGAADVAAALRTAESWEGPMTDGLRDSVRTAAENIRAIIAEAQKKVSLP